MAGRGEPASDGLAEAPCEVFDAVREAVQEHGGGARSHDQNDEVGAAG